MVGSVEPVAISLGSNLGDREAHLRFAIERLTELLSNVRVSSFRETLPQGVPEQPLYLNGVVVGETDLGPQELLARLLSIERERGRQRPFPGAARTLDLDLILYGSRVMETGSLTLPHPRFRERRFVLEPLAEVAPTAIDPVTGQSVSELLREISKEGST